MFSSTISEFTTATKPVMAHSKCTAAISTLPVCKTPLGLKQLYSALVFPLFFRSTPKQTIDLKSVLFQHILFPSFFRKNLKSDFPILHGKTITCGKFSFAGKGVCWQRAVIVRLFRNHWKRHAYSITQANYLHFRLTARTRENSLLCGTFHWTHQWVMRRNACCMNNE